MDELDGMRAARRMRVIRVLVEAVGQHRGDRFTPAERAEGIAVKWWQLAACNGMGGAPRAWEPLCTQTLRLAGRLGVPRGRLDQDALPLAKKVLFGADLVELFNVRSGQAALQMHHARAVLRPAARRAIERLMAHAQVHAKRNEQPLPAAIEVVLRELHEGPTPADPYERLGIEREGES